MYVPGWKPGTAKLFEIGIKYVNSVHYFIKVGKNHIFRCHLFRKLPGRNKLTESLFCCYILKQVKLEAFVSFTDPKGKYPTKVLRWLAWLI